MDYQKVYNQLVQKNHTFSEGEYFETHHKIPKCIGGTDDKSNLVDLTAREHYIAHLLLVKITEQNGDKTAHGKMLYAFNCMKWGRCDGERTFKYNSRLYQKIKSEYANLRKEMMKSPDNPHIGTIWIYSDVLKQNKQICKDSPIPEGWSKGRVINWEKYKQRKQYNEKKQKLKKLKIKHKIEILTLMYHDYIKYGLQYVRNKYNYNKSEENLGMAFKRYVSEYDNKALCKATNRLFGNRGQRHNKSTVNLSREEKIEYFTKVYEYYKTHTFNETKGKFNWTKTRNALTYNFRTYVKNYVPV